MHPSTSRIVLVALALSWLAACPPPDDVPDAAGGQDAGKVADDAGAPLDTCAGALGCSCRPDGGCDRGQCVAGQCTLCTRGELGCSCRADGSCLEGLCKDDVCAVCEVGQLGCACAAGTCAAGLACDDGTCVTSACPAGAVGCPCRARTQGACDDGATCLGDGLCYACEGDRAGCPCVDDTCSDGLVCAGECRGPVSCQDLVDDGFCAPNQACGPGPDGDAVCAPGECVEGFVFFGGECVPGRPNCGDGTPGSLLGTCGAQFRQCVETATDAYCGDCLGDAQAFDGVCVGRLACGDVSCFEDEYCDVTGAQPTCAPLPCPEGSALTSLGECQACNFSCSGPGLSGRVWPFRSADGSCICETTPGYFMLAGGDTEAELCDQDGDGWVREETRDPALLIDGALAANARCGIAEVDTVLLRDEHGLDLRVVSCVEGLLVDPVGDECSQRVPMPLVESLRNDVPGPLPLASATPAYGARSLLASEVNGLTKACVDGLADFNHDGKADLVEVQAMPHDYANDPNSGRARMRSFSYFMETHRSYLEVKDGKPRLVIEERRRCSPRDFPLRYDPGVDPLSPTDAYRPDEPSLYWRSCQRKVDVEFVATVDPIDPKPGFDFAQWSCPDGGAACSPRAVAPPYVTDLSTPTPIGQKAPTNATLCELGTSLPGDRVWRGMHHHSQFKCVRVTPDDVPAGRPASAFGASGGLLVMNRCEARDCPPGVANCLESRSVVPGAGAIEPIIDCVADPTPENGQVGFAAVTYDPYGLGFTGGYLRGCVNEDHEFRDLLCPSPVESTDPNWTVDPGTDGFGRQTCFIGPCPEGRAECNDDPYDGCEQDATLNESCGGCPSDPAAKCFPQNATGQCDELGRCQIASCNEGWGDCDDDASTGCEASLLTLDRCGACVDAVCDIPDATESCATGVCEIGACELGTANCNGDLDDGCEADVTGTPAATALVRCGGCTEEFRCAPANATPACVINDAGDAYECAIAACHEGFADCDGLASNGCEANLLLDPHNCGGCGEDCGFEAAHAVGQCLGGQCQVTGCAPADAWGNCDADNGDPGDVFGCEAHLKTDVKNCGSCGTDCFQQLGDTANPACGNGACGVASCLPGRANCDNQASNGCEVDLRSSSCGSATDVGSAPGDSQCGVFCTVTTNKSTFYSGSGRGSRFFKARVVDKIGVCSEDLKHEIALDVPSGADYDLYVYYECGGSVIASSAQAGVGVDETVTLVRTDGTTADRSANYLVEVRWRGGSTCNEWNIAFRGRDPC